MRKVKVLLLLGYVFFTVNSANAHFTVCAGGPDLNNKGLCVWKDDREHGLECTAGICFTVSPMPAIATCDCIGTVTIEQVDQIQ